MIDWFSESLALFQARVVGGALVASKAHQVRAQEWFKNNPERMRCDATLNNPQDFAQYLATYAEFDTAPAVFVEAGGFPEAQAVMNFGDTETAMWQDHQVLFAARPAPLLDALLDLIGGELPGGTVSQRALLDFIDDWKGTLRFECNGKPVPFVEARARWADMTVSRLNESRSNRTEAFDRELSATERLSLGLDLPHVIRFDAALFNGFAPREVQVSLRAASASAALAVELRIVGWDVHLEAMRDELRSLLTAKDNDVHIFTGRLTASCREKARKED